MQSRGDREDGAEVVARSPKTPRFFLWWLPVQAALIGYWLSRIVSDDPTTVVTFSSTAAGACLAGVVLLIAARRTSARRATLVLTDAELRVERDRAPVTVPRHDVVAVRGTIASRPSWSDAVLVETSDAVIRLPPLDRAPGVLVPRLQQWAGVGETPREPLPPTPGTRPADDER